MKVGGRGPVRIRDGIRYCLVVFFCARVLLSLLGVVGVHAASPDYSLRGAGGPGSEVPATAGWHNTFDGTNRFDASWFLDIAQSGYSVDNESAAFFPGFPIAVRIASLILPGDSLIAALAVSNLSFLVGLIVLYALTTLEFDESRARRTVALIAFFPSSFFFLAPYAESLFLVAALLAFWWSRGDRPLLAAIAGFVAAGVKSTGVLIVPALVFEAVSRSGSRRELARRVGLCLVPLAAPALYGAYWLDRTGDVLEPVAAQGAWMRSLQIPVVTIGEAIALGVQGLADPRGMWWAIDLLLTAALLIPLLRGWRELRGSYLIFVGFALLLPLTFPFPPRPLLSMPRFVIVLFPMFWSLAGEYRDPRAFKVMLAVSVVGYSIFAVWFMNWGFNF